MPQLPLGLDRFVFQAPTLIEWHQASVHFPIALLLTSLFCDGAGAFLKVRGARSLRATAIWTQLLGTLGAIVSTALGWFGNPVRGKTGEFAQMVTVHQWWGIATLVIFLLLGTWRLARRGYQGKIERAGYALTSVLGAGVLGITGWLGGQLGG